MTQPTTDDTARRVSHKALDDRAGHVVVFGSLNADLAVRVDRHPRPGETLPGSELVTASGGKSANQAVAAATLGSAVRLLGAVGDDGHGRFLRAQVEAAGVDVKGVVVDRDASTGSAMIVVDAGGENTIIVSAGANGRHTEQSVQGMDLTGAAVLCLCLEVPLDAVQAAAKAGQAADAIVVLNPSPYAELPSATLAAVDVLVMNGSEAAEFLGLSGDADLRCRAAESVDVWSSRLDALVNRGVQKAVVTLGPDGAVVLDATASSPREEPRDVDDGRVSVEDGRVTTVSAPTVEAVDTTGCGDAFTGALAHRLAAGASLPEAASFAVEVGALAATREGAQASYAAFQHLSAACHS
ncbi:MAG: ribokinase [Ornithinimicrobium sp.]